MLSVAQCRKIEPLSDRLSDRELAELCGDYQEIAQLAFYNWLKEKGFQKSQEGIAQKLVTSNI